MTGDVASRWISNKRSWVSRISSLLVKVAWWIHRSASPTASHDAKVGSGKNIAWSNGNRLANMDRSMSSVIILKHSNFSISVSETVKCSGWQLTSQLLTNDPLVAPCHDPLDSLAPHRASPHHELEMKNPVQDTKPFQLQKNSRRLQKYLDSLKLTQHLKLGLPNFRNFIFQPSRFKCELLVP